jgi:tRNA modification GTPase
LLDDCLTLLAEGSRDSIRRAAHMIRRLIEHAPAVTPLIHGARIVVVGPPNAGKSTLVNALSQREQILVSDVPGTTRDYVEQPAAIEGVPVTLVDTAGIRETNDPLERESIARTQQQWLTADLILHVLDASADPPLDDKEFNAASFPCPRLTVWNKLDRGIHPRWQRQNFESAADGCPISARSGAGLNLLQEMILSRLGLVGWQSWPATALTPRQQHLLSDALSSLVAAPADLDRARDLLQLCRFGTAGRDDISSAWL